MANGIFGRFETIDGVLTFPVCNWQIFGKDRIAFFQIPELIMPHMLPIEPIIIPYTVR